MFGAMLGALSPAFGAHQHEGDWREPQAGHDHHVLLSTPFCGTAFEDETTHAGEPVSITAMNTLGAATLGLCLFLVSVLVLRRCRKKMDVVLAVDISAPFF